MYNAQVVSDRIDSALKTAGKLKTELNEYCGISKNAINQLKTRDYGLNAKILYSIADFFGCSTDYLLGRTDMFSISGGEEVTEDERMLLSAFRKLPKKMQYIQIGRLLELAEQEEKYNKKEA